MKKIPLIVLLIFFAVSCNLRAAPTELPTATAESAPAATLPPTPTPSPTLPPPTPTPVPLFFTEEFEGEMGAWRFFQSGGAQEAQFSLENGALQILMNAPHTWSYAVFSAHDYESVFVSAKVSGAPAGSLGLVCGFSEENGWFEFNISHEGTYSLLQGKWLAEGIAEYRPILLESSEYLQAGSLDYELGLTCKGNAIFMSINGKTFRKADVSHIGLFPGRAGIAAAAYDSVPMRAAVEWFKIAPPE